MNSFWNISVVSHLRVHFREFFKERKIGTGPRWRWTDLKSKFNSGCLTTCLSRLFTSFITLSTILHRLSLSLSLSLSYPDTAKQYIHLIHSWTINPIINTFFEQCTFQIKTGHYYSPLGKTHRRVTHCETLLNKCAVIIYTTFIL